MSFYFKIITENRISYQDLISNLELRVIKIIQSNKLDDLINEESCKFYIKNESTRGVTLKYLNSEYLVGINIISSESDFKIALKITEVISVLTDSLILPEDRDQQIDTKTFKNEFDKIWIDKEKLVGIEMFFEKIGNEGNTLAISCCNLTYFIGPKIHRQLNLKSKQEYYHSLVNKINSSQFFDRQKFAIPNTIQISSPETGDVKRAVVLYQNGNQFLPKSEFLIIKSEKELIELPFELINEIANNKFSLFDEEQYFVNTLTEDEFQNLFLKAKEALSNSNPNARRQDANENKPNNKWWKFW